jgi:hypothetical protein
VDLIRVGSCRYPLPILPSLSSGRNVRALLRWVVRGAILAGAYGAVHDQLTYSISQEYFTRFKFHQFHYLDVGLPARAFAAAIGFQATWPVGALIGWVLARYRLSRENTSNADRDILWGFATVVGFGVLGLASGLLYGYLHAYHFPLEQFLGWEMELQGEVLQRFVVVACIHNAGYLAALLGMIVARFAVLPKLCRHAPHLPQIN